jgi:hypothetical protein
MAVGDQLTDDSEVTYGLGEIARALCEMSDMLERQHLDVMALRIADLTQAVRDRRCAGQGGSEKK